TSSAAAVTATPPLSVNRLAFTVAAARGRVNWSVTVVRLAEPTALSMAGAATCAPELGSASSAASVRAGSGLNTQRSTMNPASRVPIVNTSGTPAATSASDTV